jgi:hypothetical protein
VTNLYVRLTISISVTVAVLMLIGFSISCTSEWRSTSASTVTRGGDRRRIRTRNAPDFGTRTNIPASSPGTHRDE